MIYVSNLPYLENIENQIHPANISAEIGVLCLDARLSFTYARTVLGCTYLRIYSRIDVTSP